MPTALSEQAQSLIAWLHRIPLRQRDPFLNGDFSDGGKRERPPSVFFYWISVNSDPLIHFPSPSIPPFAPDTNPKKMWRVSAKRVCYLSVLVAQVIHHYSKTLVSAMDIQRLEDNVQMGWDKRVNWIELDPVFAALNIRIYEQSLQGIMLNLPGYVEQLLTVLRAQLERHVLDIPPSHQHFPEFFPPDSTPVLRTASCASSPRGAAASAGLSGARPGADTPVLRMSNVDYRTQKAHVVNFLRPWGGPTDPSRVRIPVSLDTGKMVYEVYVVFDSTESAAAAVRSVLAASAAATGGPPRLLNRRIDMCLVGRDELHVAFFGRTHRHIDETSEFLTEQNKEKMLKLCRSYKNWFNSHTPARPFEFIVSFIELLPWHDPSFAKEQRNRAFELLRLSILTLVSHQVNSRGGNFPPDLVPRMVDAARLFTEQQQASLANCLQARQQDVQQRRRLVGSPASIRRSALDDERLFNSASRSLLADDPPALVHGGASAPSSALLELQQQQALLGLQNLSIGFSQGCPVHHHNNHYNHNQNNHQRITQDPFLFNHHNLHNNHHHHHHAGPFQIGSPVHLVQSSNLRL